MSTKQQTQQQQSTAINYDPTSSGVYGKLQPQIGSVLGNYMSDPLKSSFFQTNLQYAMKNANQAGRNNISNFFNNMRAGGGGSMAMSPFQQAGLAQAGRANSGLRANAFNQTLLDAAGKRLQATGMAQAYQPLMTGSNSQGSSTSTTSGLGTWLPQLIGAGIGAAGMAMTGGASGAMGAAGGGGAASGASSMFSSGGGLQPFKGGGFWNPGALSSATSSMNPNPFFFNGGS